MRTDLPFANTVRVNDGDHAGAERGATAGVVRCALLIRSPCRYGAGQLGDNFTHDRQASLEGLQEPSDKSANEES